MKTITVNLYNFAELSEEAKEKAIETERESIQEGGFAWTDAWIDSAKRGLSAFGAELKDWSIDCLNINQSTWKIANDYNENAEQLTGVRLRTYLLNNFYPLFFERKTYSPKYQSKIRYTKTCCPFTGYCGDENFMDVFRAFIKKPDNSTLSELLENAVEATFRGLEKDCEYQLTDEAIIETIEANGWTYEEDGTMNNG